MNVLNILLIFIFPLSKIERSLNEYCNNILSQIKKVYNENNKDNTYILNNRKNINLMLTVNSNSIFKNQNSLIQMVDKSFINKEINDSKFEDNKFDKKYIEKIKKLDDSEYYDTMLIKNFPFEERKKFLSENELHNLYYIYAIDIDDRKQNNYYFSLLKYKNKILSIFLNREDYNILAMKISLFLVSFNLSFACNALFFNDEAISKINKNENTFSLSAQIAQIIYSSIISIVIETIIEFFALTDKDFVKTRNFKEYNEAKNYCKNLVRIAKKKFIAYYVISIIFNLLFLYYVTAFCAIYSITQITMISNSLISFLLSMSYTLLLMLIPPIIRIPAIKKRNKCGKFLYYLSRIISLI